MTLDKVDSENTGFWSRYSVIAAAVVILVVIMLPPVKRWLNSIPHLWTVLYPLLSVFSLYVLIKVIQGKEGLITIIKWSLLLISALAMTVAVLGLGAAFFTVGETLAVVFIILELVTFIYDVLR